MHCPVGASGRMRAKHVTYRKEEERVEAVLSGALSQLTELDELVVAVSLVVQQTASKHPAKRQL